MKLATKYFTTERDLEHIQFGAAMCSSPMLLAILFKKIGHCFKKYL